MYTDDFFIFSYEALTPNAPPAEVTVQKTVEDCQRYRDKLYWRCRLYFRDWPDYAEDCVQEAYIELMQALRAGRCIHNYEAWLFKVAILKGQVMIREEKMRREMQFENSSDKVIAMEQAGIYQQTFPSETDPDPTDEEIRRRAVTVLSKLNDTDRRIYYEHYVRRKPLWQVAAELNMTENAVSKRHVRLKEKIKRSIRSLK